VPAGGRPELLTPRARVLLPIFLVALVALTVRQLACVAPARVVLSGPTMGTSWSVTLSAAGRSRADLSRAESAVLERLAAVDRLMSTWDPDSELSRFNRHMSTEPFPLSPETLEVLHLAQQVSKKTGGAFDITVRPLVAAWGFGANARIPGDEPGADELAEIRSRVGFAFLELDLAAGAVRKRQPELECDLSGIAKGFAIDEVARVLSELDWTDFLAEIGGEVRARGERPGGGSWRIGIDLPDAERRAVQGSVELDDIAMATSGDYRSFYEDAGERRTHIIDPHSGRPLDDRVASVSVVHTSTALADAWATALVVLGAEKGASLAEAEGIGAYFIVRSGSEGFETRRTSAFPMVRDPHSGQPPAQPGQEN
jgi:thiamine biosynthesis lipoprotein